MSEFPAPRRCYNCEHMDASNDYYDGLSFGCRKDYWRGFDLDTPSDFRDALEKAVNCKDFTERLP